jgi:hypothetical protein
VTNLEQPGTTKAARAEIFCGATIPARKDVDARPTYISDSRFNAWLSGIPFQGFTVLVGAGYWRDTDAAKWSGVERSRVLVVYGPATKAFYAQVRAVAESYARTFSQDAVAYGFAPAAFHLTGE